MRVCCVFEQLFVRRPCELPALRFMHKTAVDNVKVETEFIVVRSERFNDLSRSKLILIFHAYVVSFRNAYENAFLSEVAKIGFHKVEIGVIKPHEDRNVGNVE